MSDHLPVDIHEERYLDVGDVRYVLVTDLAVPTDGTPYLIKSAGMVRRYLALFERLDPRSIVELGIDSGASTAVFADLAPNSHLVAVDLSPDPPPTLTRFIEERGAQERVRPYYGVDQGDRERLTQIIDLEFGDRPLDIVIDDASHLLEQTTASFELLFPRLAPGGVFCIEDWEHDVRFTTAIAASIAEADPTADARAGALGSWRSGRPLIDLIMELVLVAASSPDVVSGITVNEYTTMVERGPAALDPTSFRLRDHRRDDFDLLHGS
jgi:predicted O-methyltransferase YrrM